MYALTTNFGRVSFQAQQWRALQLVQIIQKIHGSDKNLKIGILGGGIAGVTCFVGLQLLGFHNAELHEAQPDILLSQSTAEHRHSHPSINDWPMLFENKRKMAATTNLPFLNWFCGTTKSVIETMRSDPNLEIFKKNVHCSSIITRIDFAPRPDRQKFVFFARKPFETEAKAQKADLVVMALGFGKERNLEHSQSRSYWWADHLKHYRSEHQNYLDYKRYVSGSGDGALIDYARLLLTLPNVVDSLEPNPALELVGICRAPAFKELENNDARGEQANLESAAEEEFRKVYLHDKTNFHRNLYKFATDLLVRGEENENAFAKFKSEHFQEGHVLNNTKLVVRPAPGQRAGRKRQRPQLTNATSPANALLFALLTQGVNDATGCRAIEAGEVLPDKGLKLGSNFPSDEHIHIARNGTEDALEPQDEQTSGLLGGELQKLYMEFKKQKFSTDDIIPSEALKVEFYQGTPGEEFGVRADLNRKYSLAQKFLDSHIGGIKLRTRLSAPESEPRFLAMVQNKGLAERNFIKIGGIEAEIFGVPTEYTVGEVIASDEPRRVDV